MSNKEKWKILCEDLMTQSIAKEKDLKSKNWKIFPGKFWLDTKTLKFSEVLKMNEWNSPEKREKKKFEGGNLLHIGRKQN